MSKNAMVYQVLLNFHLFARKNHSIETIDIRTYNNVIQWLQSYISCIQNNMCRIVDSSLCHRIVLGKNESQNLKNAIPFISTCNKSSDRFAFVFLFFISCIRWSNLLNSIRQPLNWLEEMISSIVVVSLFLFHFIFFVCFSVVLALA